MLELIVYLGRKVLYMKKLTMTLTATIAFILLAVFISAIDSGSINIVGVNTTSKVFVPTTDAIIQRDVILDGSSTLKVRITYGPRSGSSSNGNEDSKTNRKNPNTADNNRTVLSLIFLASSATLIIFSKKQRKIFLALVLVGSLLSSKVPMSLLAANDDDQGEDKKGNGNDQGENNSGGYNNKEEENEPDDNTPTGDSDNDLDEQDPENILLEELELSAINKELFSEELLANFQFSELIEVKGGVVSFIKKDGEIIGLIWEFDEFDQERILEYKMELKDDISSDSLNKDIIVADYQIEITDSKGHIVETVGKLEALIIKLMQK